MSTLLPERLTTGAVGPVLDLAAHGGRTALHTPDGTLTYDELAGRAADVARDVLGPTRRLVLIEGANHVDALTAYLAALQHGHVALLVPDGRESQLQQVVEAYDPDVVLRRAARERRGRLRWQAEQRRDGTAHDLHPDLALLLSTSGSTGSPKLVRLSADNVRSNAAAIASYLRLTPADRAATSLPMHYCYGLSVVNSHLHAGAGLALTDTSVVDPCFWDLVERAGATSFAGVPYTFDLLDSSGFGQRRVPTLRQVTQAGGRLAPQRVREYAARGRREGWDFVVMYGATEATARMAYLPPELAVERPEAIGVAVPGGSLRLEPVPEAEPGVGELVYEGPNVMLGYAEEPADLALGRVVDELRTGDLARERDGLFEVVGRRTRHAKLFGLRIDLDRVERLVSLDGPVRCVAVDDVLHAFATAHPGDLAERLGEAAGLPPVAVRVHLVAELPVTASGKPDHAALVGLVESEPDATSVEPVEAGVSAESLRKEYALVLRRPDATTADTFVGLGGDSLSYVELATRLARHLPSLPPDWPSRPIEDLSPVEQSHASVERERREQSRPPRTTALDTTIPLRAAAIVAIVATHANLVTVVGGAHVLLAVAGYNFARFQLADVPRRTRVRNALASIAQVAVPSALVIGALSLITGFYDPSAALFLTQAVGSDSWTVEWQLWFLEALVWTSVAATALLAVPAVDRLERRAPYAVAAALLALALLVRFAWVGVEAGPTERYTIGVVAWCFALGWLAARATSLRQRLVVVLGAAVGVAGFFGDPVREGIVLGGVAVLALVPQVRVPRLLVRPLHVLAASSLFVYLTHWQVYPHLEVDHPLLATLSSFAVGVAAWWLSRPLLRRLGARMRTTHAG